MVRGAHQRTLAPLPPLLDLCEQVVLVAAELARVDHHHLPLEDAKNIGWLRFK